MTNALIMVDLQNDFCPGGSLPVAGGDTLMAIANRLQTVFDCVVASRDWHPQGHKSFACSHPGKVPGDVISLGGLAQILWPVHCVQDTQGAEFHSDLVTSYIQHIVYKGTDPEIDSYSAFFDNAHKRDTGLAAFLRGRGIKELWLMGLATDYCVKYSCLDAVSLGFKVYLITDACRGVELTVGDCASALQEMTAAGVIPVLADQV